MLEAVKNLTVATVDKASSTSDVKNTQKVVEQSARQQAQKQVSEQELRKQMEELNKALDMMNIKREFEVDKDLGEVVVKIVDTQNDKVVRQIPPEEVLKLAKNIREMVGLLFDKTT
ncbi:flagellar protein FlaG [Deferribacter desulfuricans SSM1]|uniref:Flagellar protein FlaG n=1 Tax=Deferribacter desulfuricans (strain DSM 14783 / JCM 11476 / NBRC 101012 / SSM1) TaxID=639282 RepID=D3P9T0_DEFDS|nr:flagellar protein FlaG [Deferribacter desulfuricans]BAI81470.1 flagellar protein FlaG [Deferribacter desulfuricans SSM1]